jgi:hypothetical protein
MVPLTKTQVWERFKQAVVDRGLVIQRETDSIKNELYVLYMEDFLSRRVTIEGFIESFLDYWDAHPHGCEDKAPFMRPSS